MVKALVLAAALLTAFDAAAQTDFAIVGDPAETIRDEADVSARAVVIGAVRPWREGTVPKSPLEAVLADIPPGWGEDAVCLALVTQDGLYEYRSTLRATDDWAGGTPVALEFSPTYDELLERYAVGEVALLARRGACDGEPTTFAAASLGTVEAGRAGEIEADPRTDEIELLINSFRADEVHLVVGAAPDYVVATCTPLERGSRVAFDHRCAVPLDAIDGPTPVQVLRLRNQTPDPRIELVLEAP